MFNSWLFYARIIPKLEINEIYNISFLNKYFNQLCKDDKIWKIKCQSDYPHFSPLPFSKYRSSYFFLKDVGIPIGLPTLNIYTLYYITKNRYPTYSFLSEDKDILFHWYMFMIPKYMEEKNEKRDNFRIIVLGTLFMFVGAYLIGKGQSVGKPRESYTSIQLYMELDLHINRIPGNTNTLYGWIGTLPIEKTLIYEFKKYYSFLFENI